MSDLPKKNVFDSAGTLIKENDVVKIHKAVLGEGAFCLKAKYDKENQRWLFYSGTVAFTWEELNSANIKSITVIDNDNTKKT